MKWRRRSLAVLECTLLVCGGLLLVVFAAGLFERLVSPRLALRQFERARETAAVVIPASQGPLDFSRWSAKRVRAYRDSLLSMKELPLAVLRIQRLHIQVPVYEGTDELVLNRGAGWIAGTARPGEADNVGIAGHRDGFFRGLKDVTAGDTIELSSTGETAVYQVDRIEIVSPDDVEVLRPRRTPSLTLVTCYPFYFIGSAPQRYIVHAALRERASTQSFASGPASARAEQLDKEEVQ
jgi:sortase A